jgi:chorismate mutase
VALLNERTRVVENIGRVKRQTQLPIYEPKREDQVFANVSATNRGPLTEEAVRRIFERIIDEMRMIQRVWMKSDGEK